MAAKVQHIGELESIPVAGINWRPLRRALGVTAFGTNAYTADAGEEIVEDHDEEGMGHEEMYVVISGRAQFTVAGEEIDAPAGTVVYLPEPADQRRAVASEDGTMILAVGGVPGTLTPSPWEYWFSAAPSFKAGDHERAYEIAAEGLEHRPNSPALHFYLGRFALGAGRREQAMEHLRKALDTGDPRVADWIREFEDLAPVRDELL